MQEGVACDVMFNCQRRVGVALTHILSKGMPPLVRLRAPEATSDAEKFDALHRGLIADAKADPSRVEKLPCCKLSDGTELVFIPVHDRVVSLADGAVSGMVQVRASMLGPGGW